MFIHTSCEVLLDDHCGTPAVIYVAARSAKQCAVAAQELRGLAQRQGLHVVAVHQDAGQVADAPLDRRPGLREALVQLELSGASILLSNAPPTALGTPARRALLHRLTERAGARWQWPTDLSNLLGERPAEVDQAYEALRSAERLLTAPRAEAGQRRRSARGLPRGAAPFGWMWRDGDLVEVPAERAAIQQLVRLRRAGRTYRELVQTLEDAGVRAPRGERWYPATVRAVIQRATGLAPTTS